jgi:hypothetical protein
LLPSLITVAQPPWIRVAVGGVGRPPMPQSRNDGHTIPARRKPRNSHNSVRTSLNERAEPAGGSPARRTRARGCGRRHRPARRAYRTTTSASRATAGFAARRAATDVRHSACNGFEARLAAPRFLN